MQKIVPCLWFDNEAEEAVKFYKAVFDDVKVLNTVKYSAETPSNKPIGSVMTIDFEINGIKFMALNGGPYFKINPSISFLVSCKTEEELDKLWSKLSEKGSVLMPLGKYPFSEKYGWLQDKYGVSWQLMLRESSQKIIPSLLFVGNVYGKAYEAIEFYTSVFEISKINQVSYYPEGDEEGKINYSDFEINGEKFIAMDSGLDHKFSFNEGISFVIYCNDQRELDYFYEHLSTVPEAEICGWLKDKYGVSWQLVTEGFEKLMTGKNAKEVTEELLKMKRLDIDKLKRVHEGR